MANTVAMERSRYEAARITVVNVRPQPRGSWIARPLRPMIPRTKNAAQQTS